MDWTEPRLQSLSQLDPDAAEEAFLNISPRFKGDSRLETLLQKLDGMPLAIKLMAKLLGGGGTITDLLEKWESESIKLLDQGGGDDQWESESASTLDQRDGYDRNIIQVSIKLSIDSFSVKGNMDAIPLLGVLAMLPAGAAVARIPDLCPSLPDWRAALSLLREAAVVYDSADGSRIQVLSPIQSYMTSHHPLGSRLLEDLRESYYALSPPEKNEAHHPAFVNVAKKLADDEVNMEAVLINALRDVNANREAAIKASVSYSRYLYYTRLRTEVIEEAVDVARKIDSPQLADCIGSSGTILTRTNQSDSAKQLLEEFVKLFVNQGYPKSLAKYLVSITNIWMKQGEHERAISMLEECRDIMLGRGEIDTAAGCLWLMGECHLRRLKYDLARSAFEQARSEFSSVGDDHHVAHCLMSLGAMLTYEGEYVEAQYVLGEALSIFMKLGLPFDVGECMSKLAVTHNRQRDYTLALAKLEEGLPIVMKTGLQSWIESYNADIGATQMMIELQVDDDDDEEEEEEEAEG
ncbi:hypothetical protein FRC03_006797 [Tulasnella sp. 419]|nr:hypothetical protein FRC03_006797 [Tulasnella sp. 419]